MEHTIRPSCRTPSIDYAGDALAGIRGVNDLMIDIVENPAWVRQAVKQLSGILIGISDELLKSIDEKITGYGCESLA